MSSVLPVAKRAHVFRVVEKIWRAHRAQFVKVVVLFTLASVASLAPPRLMGLLVDRLRAGMDAADVGMFGAAMLASVVVQALFILWGTHTAYRLGEVVFARLREDFLERAVRLPLGVLERGGTGELLTRTTQDITAVSNLIRKALPESFVAAVTVVLILVAATITSPLIAPVFVLAVPILVPLMRWYLARAVGVYQRLSETWGPIFSSIDETANGARAVEALRLAEARSQSMDAALASHWIAAVDRIRLRQRLLPWSNLAFAVPVFASLAWGGWLALHDYVSIGDVVSVTLFAVALVTPLEALIGWSDEVQQGGVSFARVLGVSEVRSADEGDAIPATRDVALVNVRFGYRADREVLHGVSLELVPGERLAMVGTSGAGKSTIARLLAGLDDPTSGRAMVGGVDAGRIAPGRRRREVMLVSQESHIFGATLRENVVLAHPDASDEEVRAALAATGALGWIDALEEGWDTIVGIGGHPLVGAQEQQVALARVVLADPHTVILDEATSAMDPTAARDLEAAVSAALRGRTVVAIAHRLFTAFDADRIAVVEAGRLVELGSHADLLAAGGRYAELWHAWRDDGAAPA